MAERLFKDLDAASVRSSEFFRGSVYRSCRRDSLKEFSQSTGIVYCLNHVMSMTWLRTKLYARYAPEMFSVMAISDVTFAIEYFVAGFAVVFRQKLGQIAVLLGDAGDVLDPAEPFQIIEIDRRDRCKGVDNVNLEIMAEEDRGVTGRRWRGTVGVANMR